MSTIRRPADRTPELRRILYGGGGLFGLGIGICMLWLIRVYEAGNPQPLNDNGSLTSLYPDAKLTAFIVLAGGVIAGLGLAVVLDAATSILQGLRETPATADRASAIDSAENRGHSLP